MICVAVTYVMKPGTEDEAIRLLTEAGVPVVQLSFGGVLAPADTPAASMATLEAACERAVRASAYREWAGRAGQVVDYQPGAAFADRLRQDSSAKAATLKRLGL